MTSIADLDRITTDEQYWAVNRAMLALNALTATLPTNTDDERAIYKEKRKEYNRLLSLINDRNAELFARGYRRQNHKDIDLK